MPENPFLLIHSDSTDGDTDIVDSSPYDWSTSISVTGSVDHSTDQAKFGTTSIHCANKSVGVSEFYMPLSFSGLQEYPSDVILDFWMFPDSTNMTASTQEYVIMLTGDWYLMRRADNDWMMFFEYGVDQYIYFDYTDIPWDTWTWIAIHFDDANNQAKVYINGVLMNTVQSNPSFGNNFYLNYGYTSNDAFDVYFDEIRVLVDPDTIPDLTVVPTEAYPDPVSFTMAESLDIDLQGDIFFGDPALFKDFDVTGELGIDVTGELGMASTLPVSFGGTIGVSLEGSFIFGDNIAITGDIDLTLDGTFDFRAENIFTATGSIDLSVDGTVDFEAQKPVSFAGVIGLQFDGAIDFESQQHTVIENDISFNLSGGFDFGVVLPFVIENDINLNIRTIQVIEVGECSGSLSYERSMFL